MNKKKNKTEVNKGKDFIEDLQKAYKFVKVVDLSKNIRIKKLKKKFNRCILVSNKIDIEKEEWTRIREDNIDIDYFFTNLRLLYPIEKLPIFELIEIKGREN